MSKIFIVILNWNKAKLTLECLGSVKKLKTSGNNIEIVIVDNDSKKAEKQKLKKSIKGDYIKLLENNKNLGFAAGNNSGIKYALKNKADYILILNNDALVDKNLLVEFLKKAKKHPKIGILSPKIYFAKGYEFHKDRYKNSEKGSVIWYAGGRIDWNNVYGINEGVDSVDSGQFDKEREVDFATGTCMFIRADSLKKAGYFDERYFMYYEDMDLSRRIKMAGYNILYVPKAKVKHKVAQSSSIGSELNDYFISRNRMLFGIQYAPIRTKAALFRESVRFLLKGRKWQKIGIKDYYLRKFGKGSWKDRL